MIKSQKIKILHGTVGYEKEDLLSPFGFKGSAITALWQVSVHLESALGNSGTGLGVYSTLWSDASVFAVNGEELSNEMMLKITKFAIDLLKGKTFTTPPEAIMEILPKVYEYAKMSTGNHALKMTFALNALVPVDFALWQLYARENGLNKFETMTEKFVKGVYTHKHDRLAGIPLITYGVQRSTVAELAKGGIPILKIKLGNDPNKNGSYEDMLAWDKNRLSELHDVLKGYSTPHTESGKLAYYLDVNGRYPDKKTLQELLKHARQIGALEHILILEEPFPEGSEIDVSDLPVPIAADESAHSVENVVELISLGYSIIALKPIAKTLSVSLLMAAYAQSKGIHCFIADLTVNPVMVDWNKCVAARLSPVPGMKIGMVESNGAQNYINWTKMIGYHPLPDAAWIQPHNGVYQLDDEFYAKSGGILMDLPHYLKTANKKYNF